MSEALEGMNEEELAETIANAQKALETKRRESRAETIAKIKELAASINMDVELTEKGRKVVPMGRTGTKVPVKYRDPANPKNQWSGRGMKPKWLQEKINAGAGADDFLLPEFKPQQAAA
ncbi:DNA-binding protein H-NS [Methylomagnum ishizawai]|uniref:DNA-binding protein H-NS n=1 Tax=Methylomagnum ishizawai TaxID=1760988 RepID=A0A1Y6CU47_9GAMM|nr:H-NS histone family protein [Methylomagnum ishizawai]SMF93951.1 DNA-binding protein H-NS [Methylomagnum ishizawai]